MVCVKNTCSMSSKSRQRQFPAKTPKPGWRMGRFLAHVALNRPLRLARCPDGLPVPLMKPHARPACRPRKHITHPPTGRCMRWCAHRSMEFGMGPEVLGMPARRGHFLERLACGTRQGRCSAWRQSRAATAPRSGRRGNGIRAATGVLPVSGYPHSELGYGTISDPETGTAWPVIVVRGPPGHDPGLTSPSVQNMRGALRKARQGQPQRFAHRRRCAVPWHAGCPLRPCARRGSDPVIHVIWCAGILGPTVILVHFFKILFGPDLDKRPQGGLEA